jgi:Mg/Co/Ni transporter MgtE
MRDDVVRCRVDDRAADVAEWIERSSYPFALVVGDDGMLLGRVRARALDRDGDRDRPVGELMELDPSTVRPHRAAGELAEQLASQELKWAIVTTPEGRLLGVAWCEDLERADRTRERADRTRERADGPRERADRPRQSEKPTR